MSKQSSFSVEQITVLFNLNLYLEKQTGIHFVKELTNLANNEKKTEIEAREFIKKNYPIKNNLTPSDLANISVLLEFYLYKVDVYELSKDGITFCKSEVKKSDWDDNFKSPSMKFFLKEVGIKDRLEIPDFFPAN